MLAWIYLFLALGVGALLFRSWFSVNLDWAVSTSLNRRELRLPLWMIKLPAAILIGLLVLTWLTYLLSYVNAKSPQPLYYGNAIAMPGAFLLCLWGAFRWYRRSVPETATLSFSTRVRKQALELAFAFCVLVITSFLMFYTLRIVDGNDLIVGLSVFSDFGPHLAVARSFSHGHNFPTEYPHFPAGDIRYHFFFQFLAGNLEYLGMPIDWAFNIPSILALLASTLLLYALVVMLFGDRLAGVVTVILFFFRSATAAWRYIQDHGTICDALPAVLTNDQFIGRTAHEDWGLWNQNVYLNQRHLPIGLTLIFLAVILMLPLYRATLYRLSQRRQFRAGWIKTLFFTRHAWLPRDCRHGIGSAIALGFIVGLAGFWNGAAVIALLTILAVLAIGCQHRLEVLIVALIALPLVFLENQFFLGWGHVAVQPQITLGFLAEDPRTWSGVGQYYLELLGIFPYALLLGLLTAPRGSFWLAVAFAAPIVLATTVQLTPDIAINHKYIMIAVMLLNLFIALLLARCWRKPFLGARSLSIVLIVALTATGVIDLITILNKNTRERSMVVKLDEPVLVWLEQHTERKDLLLTDWYSLHAILLSGRKIFYGWPYYAWSAGYPTLEREARVKDIYGGKNAENIRRVVRSEGIDYIVIDPGNRDSKIYQLNEPLLRATFPVVYDDGTTVVLAAHQNAPHTR